VSAKSIFKPAFTVPQRGIVVGASCRAAAQGLRRAGVSRIDAWDEFLDADLLEIAQSKRWQSRQGCEVGEVVGGDVKGVPLLLCGGMENRIKDVEAWLAKGCLCGVDGEALRRLRSVSNWEKWSTQVGIRWPRSVFSLEEFRRLGLRECDLDHWVSKSLSGAGGIQVRGWDSIESLGSQWHEEMYLQERVFGRSIGATFCSDGDGVRLVGIARGITAEELPGPLPYIYRGSIGPCEVPNGAKEKLLEFGSLVTSETGVRGLWQTDLILGADEALWVLEINPRWSASMELHEIATGVSWVAEHLRALHKANGSTVLLDAVMLDAGRFVDEQSVFPERGIGQGGESGVERLIGKGIVYAPVGMRLERDGQQWMWENRWDGKNWVETEEGFMVADIPEVPEGEPGWVDIEGGMPIASVLVCGESDAEVMAKVRGATQRVLGWLKTV